MTKKIALLSCTFTVLCALLFFRVFSLCVTKSESAQAASRQSNYTLTADTSRGMIYDCHLTPLVNNGRHYIAASSGSLSANAALKAVFPAMKMSSTPFLVPLETPLYSSDVSLLSCVTRYADPLAVHVIGHLDGDGNGAYGIERAYNDYLSRLSGKLKIRYKVDALYRALDSVQPEILSDGYNTAEGLVLTLDRQMQKIVEEEAPARIEQGAVLITDVHTGAVRACLSLPDFDPNDLSKDLNNPQSPFINRAFSEHAVGSTFKLAVTALALENGISTERTHTCEGWVNIGGQVFTCKNHALPKTMNMVEALECSCNTYFIGLAQELTANRLAGFVKLLGFGEANILAQNMTSAAGVLPSLTDLLNPAELANFGFGQGKLTATPVQIAALISAIANDGISVSPYLVEGTTSAAGSEILSHTPRAAGQRVFSVKTAKTLQQMMISVVENGSGTRAKPENGSAGGKTASAQTGKKDEQGEELVDAWFSGFYPADQPRYAIVIVNEGKNSGSRYAAPLFKAICDRLYLSEKYG